MNEKNTEKLFQLNQTIAGYDEVIGQLKLINNALSAMNYRLNSFKQIQIGSELHQRLGSEIITLNTFKESLWETLKRVARE